MPNKIEKVIVKGFKSHVNSEFTYAPGLTVVTGPTDSGKSAGIMQPIKWVAFGEPAGESFLFTIHDPKTGEVVKQAEAAEVEIYMSGGPVVKKIRRKGKTSWYMDGELISEKADTPEEVKRALGLSKQTYGDFETSLNFAYQLEAPFILSEPASVGAKVLGKLAGTEVVDKAISNITKRVHKAREDKAMAQRIIDQVNVELVEFLQVDDLLTQVKSCEAILTQLENDVNTKDCMDILAARYGVLMDAIDDCTDKLNRLAVIHDLGKEMEVIELAQARYDTILEMYSRINRLNYTMEAVQTRIDALKDLGYATELLGTVENEHGHYSFIDKHYMGYVYVLGQISSKEADIERYKGVEEVDNILVQVGKDNLCMIDIDTVYNYGWIPLTRRIDESNTILVQCKDVAAAAQLITVLDADMTGYTQLTGYQDNLCAIDEGLRCTSENIKSFLQITDAKAALDAAKADHIRLESLRQATVTYDLTAAKMARAGINMITATEDVKSAEEALKQAWEAAGEICPLCEQPINRHSQLEQCKA